MKKAKVFFHPIDDSGSLTISWSSGPKGDAVEANKGSGVGFFSDKGDLLCVIFDEVKSDNDHQILEFASYRVEVITKAGQVSYTLQLTKTPSNTGKTRKRKKSPTSNRN